MKVVTWNVNSLKVRMPRVLELLAGPSDAAVGLPGELPEDEARRATFARAPSRRITPHSSRR